MLNIEIDDKKETNLERGLFSLFIFFCLVPYLNIFRIPTDAQPNALVIAIIIFIIGIRRYRYHKQFLYISLLMIITYTVGSIFGGGLDFSFFRSLIGYLSLFFITLISYISFKKGYTISWKWFKIFIYVNIFVSIIQLILGFNFVEFLFYRVSTTVSRGVTGLAPEPTFNSTIAIFCATIYLLNYYDKRRNYILIIITLWIVVLAQSSTIVLMTVPVISAYFICKHFKKVFLPLLLLIICVTLFFGKRSEKEESSRLATVLNVVMYNPSSLLILDGSVNERISHIVIPTYVSLIDFMRPHGSDMSAVDAEIRNVRKNTNYFYFSQPGAGLSRIMSGWSMIFYEVGFFAFVFFFYMLYLVFFRLDNFGVEFLGAILFIVIVLTAITINTAIVPFIFGNILYKASLYRKKHAVENRRLAI